jgi:hypothetical protein
MIISATAILALSAARAGVPEQAQASNLAVPTPVVFPYAGALVVSQCKKAIGVIFVTHDGQIVPYDPEALQKLTLAQLNAMLAASAPLDNSQQIETPCTDGTEKSV